MRTGRPPRHGMTGSPTWGSWQSMMTRCYNKSQNGYKYWGGRGIRVCDRWLVFENFLEDMGERPKGTSIDRRDNDGNYEPGNCRWATAMEQGGNRRGTRIVTWQGESHHVTEWSRILGIRPNVIFSRLYAGWSLDDVMTKGHRQRKTGFIHPATLKTHCKRGHALDGENLRINPAGQRSCVICNLELGKLRYRRKMEKAHAA